MEAKDTKKYRKELSVIGQKLNDLGARCATRYENDEQTLEDICKVGEDVFELSFKAGQEEVIERGNNLLDKYSQSSVTSFWMEVVSQSLITGKPS